MEDRDSSTSGSAAAQIKSEVREIFRGKYQELRKQAKTDFPCFAAMMLGSMSNLYLVHFSPCRLVDDPDTFNAGFYDEDNQQILQLLVRADGDYGLLNLNLENGLGEKNERVSEGQLRTLWDRWNAEG